MCFFLSFLSRGPKHKDTPKMKKKKKKKTVFPNKKHPPKRVKKVPDSSRPIDYWLGFHSLFF